MGISNSENGITNNPAELMNAVLHNFQGWKQVPLDVICISLFHLSCYYQRESIRGYHLCDSWQFKDAFTYMQRDPSLIPFLPKGIDPKLNLLLKQEKEFYCHVMLMTLAQMSHLALNSAKQALQFKAIVN